MPKYDYDRQFILQVDMDPAAGSNRTNLESRAQKDNLQSSAVRIIGREREEGSYVKLSEATAAPLREGLRALTNKSRLYLVGHGDWQSQKVGDLSGRTMAKLLWDHGFRAAHVISVVACEAARDTGAGTSRVAHSANSFAQQFHEALLKYHNLNIDVLARTREVSVSGMAFDPKKGDNLKIGRKVTKDDLGIPQHQVANTKIRFTYRGGQQVREYVNLGGTDIIPVS